MHKRSLSSLDSKNTVILSGTKPADPSGSDTRDFLREVLSRTGWRGKRQALGLRGRHTPQMSAPLPPGANAPQEPTPRQGRPSASPPAPGALEAARFRAGAQDLGQEALGSQAGPSPRGPTLGQSAIKN